MTDPTFSDSYIATDAATQCLCGNGPEVQPGLDAVEFYLEAAQAAVLQLAQDLAAQEAGIQ